jgi:hypothetical protein
MARIFDILELKDRISASKVQVARSNRAGQAKNLKQHKRMQKLQN